MLLSLDVDLLLGPDRSLSFLLLLLPLLLLMLLKRFSRSPALGVTVEGLHLYLGVRLSYLLLFLAVKSPRVDSRPEDVPLIIVILVEPYELLECLNLLEVHIIQI